MTEFESQFYLLAPLSLSLIVAGLFEILFPKLSPTTRIVVSGGLIAAAIGAASSIAENEMYAGLAIAVSAATLVLSKVVRSIRSRRGVERVTRSPLSFGIGVTVAGVALLALTVVRYENGLTDQTEIDSFEMGLMTFVPERVVDEERQLLTDRGQVIPLMRLKVPMSRETIDEMERRAVAMIGIEPGTVQTGPANDATNCHGWVFAGGRGILANGDVDTILADNDYRIVIVPAPGDIAVFRSNGAVSHTAIVRDAEPGGAVVVEGKWSWMGIYLEPVDRSIYGRNYAFYRSTRADHIVRVFDRTTTPFTGAE